MTSLASECGGSGQSVTQRTVQDRIQGLGAERSLSMEQEGETESLLRKVLIYVSNVT